MIRFIMAAAVVGLTAFALMPSAKADAWDKRTVFTVNQPIQVIDTVLPAGKYVMKLVNSSSDRHIVQIFNQDENHVITTVLAIPDYRLQPTGKTVLTFYETVPGQPKALRDWFYPGDNFGQQFPKPKLVQTASVTPEPATTPVQPATLAPAPQPEPQQEVAQNTPPPPAPVEPPQEAAPAPQPAPEPTPAPAELPKTGSDLPWIGLAGLGSLGIFALVRVLRLA